MTTEELLAPVLSAVGGVGVVAVFFRQLIQKLLKRDEEIASHPQVRIRLEIVVLNHDGSPAASAKAVTETSPK